MKTIEILGNRCQICQEDDPRVLVVHHVNCDGKKDPSGTYFYQQINKGLRETSDLALLCANCHTKIHSIFNNGLWGELERHLGRIRASLLLQSHEMERLLRNELP